MKDKKIFLLFFVILILVTSFLFVSAKTIEINLIVYGLEPIQQVEYYYDYPIYHTIFSNYSVEFYGLRATNFRFINETFNGIFIVKLLSGKEVLYETGFEPIFFTSTESETQSDVTLETLYLPYFSDARYLKVYYQNEEKLNVDISQLLCNYNGECDGSENYLSCSDCKINAKDGLCMNAGEELGLKDENNETLDYWEDGLCDLDCYKDDDCEVEGITGTGQAIKDIKEKVSGKLGIILILLVVVIAYLVWKRFYIRS